MSERAPAADPSPEGNEQAEGSETLHALNPRIWVGSLLDYNTGRLFGDWLSASQDDEALYAAVQHILANSPTAAETDEIAEEWGIFDYDEFGDWKPGEYENLHLVAAVARGIRDHGPAFGAYADLHDADPDMLAAFEDAYLGEYDSAETWAEQLMDDTGAAETLDRLAREYLGDLARYVRLDTEAFAHDAHLSGDITVMHREGGGVWIFNANP